MTRSNSQVQHAALADDEASNDSSCERGHQHQAPAQRCTLVVTRLAPGVCAGAVSDIFKRCRERHGRLAVTGTMLFDGERVGALFCGLPDHVGLAVQAITSDPRQAQPLVLMDANDVPPWAAESWHAGWCEPDALAALTDADAPKGPAAVETWRTLMAASDLL